MLNSLIFATNFEQLIKRLFRQYVLLPRKVEQLLAAFIRVKLRRIFRAFEQFKQCFSTSSGAEEFKAYQACTEQPLGLLVDQNFKQRKEYTLNQARGYVKIIAQFDFACGAGLGSNNSTNFLFKYC